jgi:hypothetical protein
MKKTLKKIDYNALKAIDMKMIRGGEEVTYCVDEQDTFRGVPYALDTVKHLYTDGGTYLGIMTAPALALCARM